MNEFKAINSVDVLALSEAINELPAVSQVINEKGPDSLLKECKKLLEKCGDLFRAEVCAIFIVRNGWAELEAHGGYVHPLGSQIEFEILRQKLRYRVELGKSEDEAFDGITGMVASTGKEFCANSWEEIKRHRSHAGKPDKLGIWNNDKPFRCMFAVPIKLAGETIGVLKVENKRDPEDRGATFDDTDKVLMRTLANCFSMAIENASLRSQLTKADEDSEAETVRDQAIELDDYQEMLGELAARHDHANMAEVIRRTAPQIEFALRQEISSLPGRPFNQVIIAGMGGSTLAAEIVMDAFEDQIRVPVKVIRNYDLPLSTNEKSLVIVSSFSGNTEETLSVVERFPDKAKNIVVISASGRLTVLANERRYPLIRIPIENEPKGLQPRSAIGYFVTYFTRLFSLNGIMDDMTSELKAVVPFIRELEVRPIAEDFAVWLMPKIPLVYTDESHLMSVARIAKIKFNENSKRPAFFNALPEANHNEMIGFRKNLGEFGILYLFDQSSRPRIRDRFSVMKKVFRQEQLDNVAFREWEIPGCTKIQRIFAALTFADWCSYTLALLDGIDPTPVALVESFKMQLASFRAEA